jgi:polyphosphate kinase
VLGRYLEHSRVFEFAAQDEVWIGSADMMHRNLDRRVEALVRVTQDSNRVALRSLLDHAFSAGVSAWELRPDGQWERRDTGPDGTRLSDYQGDLSAWAQNRA